jgi:acyl dehydratase
MDQKYAHELTLGDSYAPLEFSVSPELNQQFLYAQEDFDQRYIGEDGTRAEVHPALLLQMSANTKSTSFRLAAGTGSILASARVRFHNPAFVGSLLRVEWMVTEVYRKRGRRYYVMVAEMMDGDGRKILTRDLHLTFPVGRAMTS